MKQQKRTKKLSQTIKLISEKQELEVMFETKPNQAVKSQNTSFLIILTMVYFSEEPNLEYIESENSYQTPIEHLKEMLSKISD